MNMNQTKAAVRVCVAAVSLVSILLLFVVGAVTVDTVSGRLLHGDGYCTEVTVDGVQQYLPMRWRVLWGLIDGVTAW